MFRQWRVLRCCNFIFPALGALGIGSVVLADPPKEVEKPTVRGENSSLETLRKTVEKLRKDLGPNDPTVKQLEETIKQLAEIKPVAPAPIQPIRPQGIEQPDLEQELLDAQGLMLQQLETMRKMIQQGGGGIQIQGGGFGGPFIIGPGNLQQNQFQNQQARRGRFGIRIEAPSDVLAAQLDLPNGQGIVCVDVPADSVAGKAGIKPHDILLEVAGKPVPNNGAEFINQLRSIKADEAIDIVLLRKGRKETIKGVKLPEAAEPQAILPPEFPRRQVIPQPFNGAINAEQIQVQQQNNAFTVQMSKPGLKMIITGEKEDGKKVVNSIEIETDGKTIRAESVEKLPKEHQELAERALKNIR